jgi:hypothetical protein
MSHSIDSDDNLTFFGPMLKTVKKKIQKIRLDDNDLLFLASIEIAKSYTRDEQRGE